MRFTVDRNRWLRGEENSSLLRGYDNKLCCVGFFCLAYGLTTDQIESVGVIEDGMMHHSEEEEKWTTGPDATDRAGDIYRANDDPEMSDPEREAKLKALFADMGHEIVFEGGIAP